MSKLVRLWTGSDGQSHFSVGELELPERPARTIRYQESPPGSSLTHVAPAVQYVITLEGTLTFTTRDGESFPIEAGDVLLAEDTTGEGHHWQLTDEAPWRRIYVELPE